MTEFMCKRCGYASNRKANLRIHLLSKKSCKVTFGNISREQLLEELSVTTIIERSYHCKYCTGQFSTQSNRNRHEKKCPNKPPDRTLEEEVKMLREEVKEVKILREEVNILKSQISVQASPIPQNTTTTVNGDNNGTVISQNITINNFNNGELINPDNIPLDKLIEALSHRGLAVTVLAKDIYYNKDDPQNHSLRVLGDTSLVHKDGKWEVTQTNEVTAHLGGKVRNTYLGYRKQSPYEFYHDIDVVNRELPLDKRVSDYDIQNKVFPYLADPQAHITDPEMYQQIINLLQEYTNRCHPKS